VSLSDQNSSLVDRLSLESLVENSGLESFVQKLIQSQTQYVIELELLIGQKSISVHSSEKGSSFKESSGVFLLQGQKLSGCFSEFGKSVVYSPYLFFIFQAIFTDKLQLMIDSLFFERSSRCLISAGI
jgi:hypothetical protein